MMTQDPLRYLEAKLEPPPLPANFLPRPQLIDHLTKALTHPLTLIDAPAGYGKTTLASHWAQGAGAPVCWLRLNEDDNQLRSFLHHLLAAIETQFHDACLTTRLILRLPKLPPFSFVKANLINELADLPESLVLVLDNFHLIYDEQVKQLVRAQIEYQPAGIRLLIVARGKPGLSLPRLRARTQVAEIGVEALAFDPDETRAYLDLAAGREVRPETAGVVTEWAEGWITGVRLAGVALRDRTVDDYVEPPSEVATQEAIVDYFSREVLAGRPPAVRQFMYRAAILEYFCAPLCDALLDDESGLDSRAVLGDLHRSGSFLLSVPDRPGWFRFHRLFRETLQQLGDKALDPATVAVLHDRASSWLAENGYVEEAVTHALEAGDLEAAAKIVEERVQVTLVREDTAAIGRWLEHLPADLVRRRPALLLAQAWQQQLLHRHAATDSLLAEAETLLEEGEASAEANRLRGEIAALLSSHSYWRGEYEESQRFARAALRQLASSDAATSHAQAYMVQAEYITGDPNEAMQRLKGTIQRQSIDPTTNLSPLLLAQAHLSLNSGRLHQLADLGRNIIDHGLRLQLPLTVAWGHYFLGRAHYEWNRLDVAAEHFSAVVKAEPPVPVGARADSLLALALIYQTKAEPNASEEAVASLEEMDEVYKVQAAAFKARLALLQGNTDEAVSWVATTAVPRAADYLFSSVNPLLIRIRVLIAQNTGVTLREAIRLLVPALQTAQASHNRLAIVKVLALRAIALAAQGHTETALEVLDRAVRMGRHGGVVRAFVDLGLPMAELLDDLVQQRENSDGYAEQLIEAFVPEAGIVHPLVAAANEALIEPLTERELEVLQMLARRLTNVEIADKLGISPLTVKKHTINIYQKLIVDNRLEAVAAARKLDLIFGL